MKKHGWLLLLIGILFGFIIAKSSDPITPSDVQSAQKLFNLHFQGVAIDTMMQYLEDNRKAYDSMRTFHLENEVPPALLFDPFPLDFLIKPNKGINPGKSIWMQNYLKTGMIWLFSPLKIWQV
jgi:hypothetical protein